MKSQDVLPLVLSIVVIIAGMKLAPMLLTGYGVWTVGAALIYFVRSTPGLP